MSSTARTFYKIDIADSGVGWDPPEYRDTFIADGCYIHFEPTTGRVYANDGIVVEAETGKRLGRFGDRKGVIGHMIPDPALGKAFFAWELTDSRESGPPREAASYDLETFRLVDTILLPRGASGIGKIIRWGDGQGIEGIAYPSEQIVLISGQFVGR